MQRNPQYSSNAGVEAENKGKADKDSTRRKKSQGGKGGNFSADLT